ncbi:NADH-quinone oxidoreductase subunit I [Balneolales bacterium ANBcel1]|nr:NADH-quinone oxidoreductase subunit I [Balneolales bacterium ANBcel1]
MVKLLNDTYTTFKTIFTGMGITWGHLFRRSVTVQYPEVRDVLPQRVRLKLDVNMDDCIGCRLCERACPVECITIGTIKSTDDDDLGETSTGHKKKLWVNEFDIDMAKCCYCELCVHPCPTDCITMVEDYEYSSYDRNDLIFSFSDMTPEQIEAAQVKLEQEEEEKKRKKEEARKAKEMKKAAEAAEAGEANEGSAEAKEGTGGGGDTDAEAAKEARRAEREARRAARKAEREAKKKSED